MRNAHRNRSFRGGETMPRTHGDCFWQSNTGFALRHPRTSLRHSLNEQSSTSRCNATTASEYSAVKKRAQRAAECSLTAGLTYFHPNARTYTLFIGFWDEFAFAIYAGVGTLPSNALLPLWNVPRRWWTSACVLGTWARKKDICDIYAYCNETARARTQNPNIHP